jgi:trehalose-phosphatase
VTASQRSAGSVAAAPRALAPGHALAARLSRSPLLVALDIDGTLAPIAPTPGEARVPDDTRRTLQRLADLESVRLAFVTGRAAVDGRRLVNVTSSWTIGNHGIEWIDPSGALRVNPAAEAYAPAMAEAARRLTEPLARFPGVLLENKTWTLSIHVRLAAPGVVPEVEGILIDIARELELRVLHGKKIFELRPPVALNKGTALVDLAHMIGSAENASQLYAGDDQTDEDGFRALRALSPNAVTIHVGQADTHSEIMTDAEFVAPDPAALHDFLLWLLAMREREVARSG